MSERPQQQRDANSSPPPAASGLALAVRPAQATPASMKQAIRQIVGEAAVKPGKVKLDLPPLVENGNTVAMSVTVDSPMTAKDHVKAIHVFTEKNPQPNVISVKLGPRAGKAGHLRRASGSPTPRRSSPSAKCPTARSGPTRST